MDKTSNLQLPYIAPNQAQKHVTHNDALLSLDAIVQLSVVSQSQTAPPSSLNEGDRFIVETNATDEWLGKDHELAAWQDGAWMFYTPQKGWLCWVEDENVLFVWDGSDWVNTGSGGSGSTNPAPLVGVNATADLTNRLSVNSPATLLNHEGSGHQLKVNKNTATDTASLLFQTDFSGHAEMGLTGDNDFHLKVSGDGNNWTDGMTINKENGHVNISRLFSGVITINDDTVVEIPTPNIGGFLLLMLIHDTSWPQTSHSGIFSYDTGPSLSLMHHSLGNSMKNLGASPLNGTTGLDGSSSIAVKSGAIVIENRFGSEQKYSFTFLG